MAQDHPAYEEDFRKIIGMDPAANWLLNVARTDYLAEDSTAIPILVEIGGDERNDMLGMLFGMLGFEPPFADVDLPNPLPLVVSRAFLESLRDDPVNNALRDYPAKRIVLSDTHTPAAEAPAPDPEKRP